jgi:hypothetical protein
MTYPRRVAWRVSICSYYYCNVTCSAYFMPVAQTACAVTHGFAVSGSGSVPIFSARNAEQYRGLKEILR